MIRRDITSRFAIRVAARGGTLTGAAGIRVAIEIGIAHITPRADSVRHILVRTAIKSDYIGIGFVQAWSLKVAAAVRGVARAERIRAVAFVRYSGVLIHLHRAYLQASDPSMASANATSASCVRRLDDL